MHGMIPSLKTFFIVSIKLFWLEKQSSVFLIFVFTAHFLRHLYYLLKFWFYRCSSYRGFQRAACVIAVAGQQGRTGRFLPRLYIINIFNRDEIERPKGEICPAFFQHGTK